MSVIAFEHLKVTTMTMILALEGTVNLDLAFAMLELTKIDLPIYRRQTKKYKLPHCKIPGAILSLRYKDYTRGIIRSNSSNHFKHSITIDVSTRDKNISVKLSSTGIQMCGPTSTEQGCEAATYVLSQLNFIENCMDLIVSNPEKAVTTLQYVSALCQGLEVERVADTTEKHNSIVMDKLVIVDPIQISDSGIDVEHLDPQLTKFFLGQRFAYKFYSDYHEHLLWILSLCGVIVDPSNNNEFHLLSQKEEPIESSNSASLIDSENKDKEARQHIIVKPLGIKKVNVAMVNYNYDIGFDISRIDLARCINKKNGFFARYDNSIDHCVTVVLPYSEETENEVSIRRKNKRRCHTFLVYKSGLVTQSSGGGPSTRDAYYLFNNTVKELKSIIMRNAGPRKLKYRPASLQERPSEIVDSNVEVVPNVEENKKENEVSTSEEISSISLESYTDSSTGLEDFIHKADISLTDFEQNETLETQSLDDFVSKLESENPSSSGL